MNQGGRTRGFTYDSLKRLRSATNPESGTVFYDVYDGNGNLKHKKDARNTETNYSYDWLNRLTLKTYVAGAATSATDNVTYCYDGKVADAADGACKYGVAIPYGWNHLTEVRTATSTTTYSEFDALGRVTKSKQGSYQPFAYEYNLAGGLTKLTYPSGRVVSYTYSGAGRAQDARKGANGSAGSYASGAMYSPHGGLTQVTVGGMLESTAYNSRLQPVSMTAGDKLSLGYFYCTSEQVWCPQNNGNLLRQKINPGTGSWKWTVDYGYDAENRLTSAVESGASTEWNQTYGYNQWGNRWVIAANPGPPMATPRTEGWFNSKNQIVSPSTYDEAGNQTSIVPALTLDYDAENRVTRAGNVFYSYDGEGRRVKKVVGTVTTAYVYDAMGRLAAEYGGGSAASGTQYLTADHLGSTRLVRNGAGTVVRYDYLPYGEEIPVGIGGRTAEMGYGMTPGTTQRFTGKERDDETANSATQGGLDYFGARYLSGAQGRFTSPDPGAYKLEDPQTFNRYAYVNNNPLKYIDPTGKEAEYVIDEKNKTIKIRASITIYGPGANAAYAAKLKTQMEGAWKGSYKDPKTRAVYKVSTTADVSVYDPMRGSGLSARNGFYVADSVSRSNFEYRHTDPRFPARFPGDPGIYIGALNPGADAERHETGHVLGQPDDYWEDTIRGITGPQSGHAGHLMEDSRAKVAAQDEIDRIGSFTLNQMRTTHKSEGTIIRLPEPPRPR